MAKREFSAGGVVVRRRGKGFYVLLIKDSYGRWTWPKGHIDKNESSEEAALREIAEEVGINDARIVGRIGKTEYFYKSRKRLRFKTVFLYLCETRMAKLKIQQEEIQKGEWFRPEEALKKVEYKGARELLRKAITKFAASLAAAMLVLSHGVCLADTVRLKDGAALKGIVVEDYADRISYSTLDGEKEILKSEIARVEYDEPLDNLINLGDNAFEKGYFKAALRYYLMAQDINDRISSLNNKIYHVESIIYKAPEIHKREYLELKNEIISGRTGPPAAGEEGTLEKALMRKLGISLSCKKRGRFYIEALTGRSPFAKAGARRGDAIISVWSKLCDYLTFGSFYTLLTNPDEPMVKIVIERELTLPGEGGFGARLIMKWEGAVVDGGPGAGAARDTGLKDGDLIVAVGKEPIRYTPLDAVMERLTGRKGETAVTIQRMITVFK